ncbi:MAG: murein biosynthesis integral membrane protein MurJ [Sphaerochaetaceae bacterium]|nr:murein biosynthesis integral membrane protein MurJ [Spirochaetales bacterium]MDY5499547.1 murein biosynthesis integral membrane protein MurJ [Sphaerochaetaceae bacterium]
MAGKTEKHSLVVMLCTMASRLLGIVRARVIATAFGSGAVGDVVNFTYNIPNNFRKLFAEGAMSSAFIPEFSKEIGEGKRDDASTLMDLLFTWQLVLFVILDLLSIRYGNLLIAFFSDFSCEQVALGARLLPFFMVFLTAISLGTIFSGMLQVHGQFFASSFAPLIFSVTAIVGISLFHGKLGPMSMAYSVMLGGIFQLGFWYLWLRHIGYRLRLRLRFHGDAFPTVIRHWLAVLCSSLLQVVGQQVSYTLASHLEQGSVTAFSNATIFWQTPYGIFFTAISTVYFPLMSQSYARHDNQLLARQVGTGLEYLATLLVPSTILLYCFSDSAVSSVLQSGAFTLQASLVTAFVVRVFSLGMVAVAWYGFLQRFCYSAGRYRAALALSVLQTVLDVAISVCGIHFGLGILSLPLANDLSFLCSLVAVLWVMRDIYQIHHDLRLWKALAKVVAANIPVLMYCLFFRGLRLTYWQAGSSLRSFLTTCLYGMIGVAVVLASYSLFRIPFMASFRKKES